MQHHISIGLKLIQILQRNLPYSIDSTGFNLGNPCEFIGNKADSDLVHSNGAFVFGIREGGFELRIAFHGDM